MNPEMVFDKERIYEKIGGYDAEGDSRVVTELIRRIRKKMKISMLILRGSAQCAARNFEAEYR